VSHLQCPECRLTVPAAAYYLRGDQCPRCMTSMMPFERPRPSEREQVGGAAARPPRGQPQPQRALRAQPT
jgi:hypothetical protein